MSVFQSIILGIVQATTEFLPISSSAHLVIIPRIFGWEEQPLFFDIILHGATVCALIIYFRNDLFNIIKGLLGKDRGSNLKLVFKILIAIIPTAIIGFLLQNFIDETFRKNIFIALSLIIVGVFMIFVEKIVKEPHLDIYSVGYKKVIIIAIAEVFALIRGVSRSGITISTGYLVGLKREEAARFSFIIGIPLILGVFLHSLFNLDFSEDQIKSIGPTAIIAGFTTSFSIGLVVIHFFLKFLKRNSLNIFGYYRIILGIILLILFR